MLLICSVVLASYYNVTCRNLFADSYVNHFNVITGGVVVNIVPFRVMQLLPYLLMSVT